MSQLEELRKAAQYEKYIETAFKELPKKKIIIKQEEISTTDKDELRLQTSLARTNLKEIVQGPALVTLIIQELKLVEGDLNEFNKYFNIFKKILGDKKIKSLQQFRDDWKLFTEQEIGKQLTIMPEIKEDIVESEDLSKLELLPSEILDKRFRQLVQKTESKPIENIEFIKYYTTQNRLSEPLRLINKDSIIMFDPIPKDTTVKDVMTKVNNVKIRYILKSQNPFMSMRNVKINWKGSDDNKGALRATGEGLITLKKRLVRTNFR